MVGREETVVVADQGDGTAATGCVVDDPGVDGRAANEGVASVDRPAYDHGLMANVDGPDGVKVGDLCPSAAGWAAECYCLVGEGLTVDAVQAAFVASAPE